MCCIARQDKHQSPDCETSRWIPACVSAGQPTFLVTMPPVPLYTHVLQFGNGEPTQPESDGTQRRQNGSITHTGQPYCCTVHASLVLRRFVRVCQERCSKHPVGGCRRDDGIQKAQMYRIQRQLSQADPEYWRCLGIKVYRSKAISVGTGRSVVIRTSTGRNAMLLLWRRLITKKKVYFTLR